MSAEAVIILICDNKTSTFMFDIKSLHADIPHSAKGQGIIQLSPSLWLEEGGDTLPNVLPQL